jgi:hypothetical protein
MAQSALHLVQQWEWDDLGAEQRCLKEWNSLLKKQTTSKKAKAVVKRGQLNVMDDVLKQEQVAIDVLDQQA